MASYLFGSPVLAVMFAVLAACTIGLASSLVFTWASGKSALWNIGFAIALVLATAGSLLLALIAVMRGLSR